MAAQRKGEGIAQRDGCAALFERHADGGIGVEADATEVLAVGFDGQRDSLFGQHEATVNVSPRKCMHVPVVCDQRKLVDVFPRLEAGGPNTERVDKPVPHHRPHDLGLGACGERGVHLLERPSGTQMGSARLALAGDVQLRDRHADSGCRSKGEWECADR